MFISDLEDISHWGAWNRYVSLETLVPNKNKMVLECCMPPLGEGILVPWGGIFTHGPDPTDETKDWFRTKHVIPVSNNKRFKRVFKNPPVLVHWLAEKNKETGYVLRNALDPDALIMSFYLHYIDFETGKVCKGECWPMNPLRFVPVGEGIFKTHDFTGLRYIDSIIWNATFKVTQIKQGILEIRLQEFEVKHVQPLGQI